MNIAEINTVNYGSTGGIMFGIQQLAEEQGHTVYAYYGVGNSGEHKEHVKQIGNTFSNKLNSKLAHFTGLMGCFSYYSTLKLICELKRNNIELIHLHNIHISFLNYPMFFKFIKKHNIKLIWTLHDCWAITGHCAHFTYPKCDKWKNGCYKCERYREYPITTIDNSKYMYWIKKRLFTEIQNATLVVPSKWLKSLVEESFLKEYPIEVINNGIDLRKFQPTDSNFRDRFNLDDKFIVLGVAFDWGMKKGLDVFVELSRRLDSKKFRIVLVGVDKNVAKTLPDNIVIIQKTTNPKELAEIYTAANVFVNPTREEVFGLVNLEANACGTPVLMFRTGGSPECIDTSSGEVFDVDDIDGIENKIRLMERKTFFKSEDCINHAKAFDMQDKYKEYIKLYERMKS